MAEIQTSGNSLGSTLSGVSSLASLFLGSSSTTSGTQTSNDNRTQTTSTSGGTNTTTTSTSTSQAAVDATVKAILEGTNGLASVSSGQRTAGLYGSSTNQLLTNDLVTRAAAEGAKLNSTTTQTAVTAPTTTTTANSGGTTTVSNSTTTKPASASATGVAGALALLQAIPKGVKDSVLSGLGIKGSTDSTSQSANSGGDSSSQQAIADAYSDPSRALDVTQGSSVGADGVASVGGVSGASTNEVDGISIGSAGSAAADVSGYSGTEDGITNFLSSNDNFASTDSGTDYLNELGSGVGDALGGFADTVSSTASDVASSVSDWFSDFDFSWADGGHISQESRDRQLADHFSKKVEEFYSKKSVPKYADGGGIGAAGDSRYGNTRGVSDAKVKREIPRGNLFEETRNQRAQDAGLTSGGREQLQEGNVPRTTAPQVSVTSIIDNLPILVRAIVGNMQSESASRGRGVSDNVPAYANGGSVTKGNTYDLDTRDLSYLANTGLKTDNLKSVSTGASDSNDQVISKMLTESLRGKEAGSNTSPIYTPGTTTAGANSQTDAAGANSSVSQPQDTGGGSAVGSGIATGEVGITGVSGLSSTTSSALGAVAGLTGVPGLSGLVGLATSNNPANSFASMAVSAAATAAGGPVAGLIASAIMSALNSQTSQSQSNAGGGNNGVGGASQGEVGNTTASVSVGEATADDGTVAVGAPVGTTSETIDADSGGDGNGGGGTGSAGGPGSGSDGGAGDSGVGGDSAGDGSSGSAGTSAGGDAWAHGGEISGPGTGVSDSILARVSDGEYIIPADVVEALGVPFFDKLRDKYHTPAKQQQTAKA